MTDFRRCPSFSGYSASRSGEIRRDAWTRATKKGLSEHDATILTKVGRQNQYVTLAGKWVKVSAMVADAWTESFAPDRPRSDYPDGRIVTLAELIAERLHAL